MEARLLDGAGDDAKPGMSSGMYVRGPNVLVGYHENPVATADCMASDGYYKTGDVAKWSSSTGNFYITDRMKELIIYKDFQVLPAELEGVFSAHPQIADVAVIGIWNEKAHTEEPRAYMVLQAGTTGSDELAIAIAEWSAARTAHYKRLRGGVRFVKEPPKNASGKILRRVLKQQAAIEASGTTSKL